MKDQWMSISDITALMEAFSKNNMGKLELKVGDASLLLKSRPLPEHGVMQGLPQQQIVISQQNTEVDSAPEASSGNLVTSPIVGTFFAAPSPEDAPFVQVGQHVQKGDVLFIIESMKLMNEVASEQSGVVKEILVENAQPVEFGQPILRIE